MNLFQLASRGIDLDALPDESAPEREPLAFEPAPAGSRFAVPQEFDAAFQAAGDEYGVDPDVLRAMAFAESRFRPDVISGQVKSRTGAAGLMQFMPGTAERFGINPLDPVESIFGAAAYMRANLEKFDGDYGKAVAAYNWGESRKAYGSDDWKDRLPAETRGYLDTVFGAADELKLRAPKPMPPVVPPPKGEAPEAAKPAIPDRSWSEAFGDTTKSLAQGLLDVGSLPGVAYSAVTGDWDTGYLKAIRGTQEVLQDQKSAEIQARNKELQSKLSTAEGWREKLAVGGIETLKDPTLLFDTLARSAPGMFAGGVVGRGAGAAANAVGNAAFAKALGTGSELAARVAVTAKNGAGVLARATATGTAAGIQGASVASETYEELSKLPVEAFKSEPEWKDLEAQHGAQQAKEILAGAAANRALLMATGASVLSMKLVPGGDAIEKMFLPPSLKGAAAKAAVASTSLLTRPMGKGMEGGLVSKAVELIVKGSQAGALESVSEGVEEGTGAIAKGLELSRAGQRVNLSEMAGEAYGQGAAAGLVMGKVAGMQEAYGSRAPRVEDQPTTPQAPIVPSAPVAPQAPQSAQADVAAQILQAEAAQPQATGLAAELEVLRARSAPAPDFTQRSTTPQAQPGSVPVTGGLAAELQALRARSSPQEAANAPQRAPSAPQSQAQAASPQAADIAGVDAPVSTAPVPTAGTGAVEAAGVKPAGQRQLSADEQAAQDREEARAKEPSLPPVLSARLQEAHKAHGRDVKRSVVERSIANEKANNTGTPKAKRERADRIARLEADLALFDEAAAMPPKEAAGLPPRGREGYDTPVTLDAASLKALVEKTRGTPLVDKPEKLEAWRNGTAKTDPAKFPIELAITPDGRLDVNDGRHRIALAAERGETVEAFIDGKDAQYAQQLVSQPSQPQGANSEPTSPQAIQAGTQPAQAAAAPAAGPAPTNTAAPAPAGASTVRALSNGTPAENTGAQAAPAGGTQGAAQAAQAGVAPRPKNWRTSMLGATPVAKAMGIDTKGKRLAQVVAEIDARDTQAPSTPAPAPAPGPTRLGRDNTPLSEGGKPFKTRKAAGDAKKLQPMMRVVTVPGGYALAEKTPAQLAAEERASRRLRNPNTSARGEPIPAHAFIAAAGGLNRVAASDMGVDGNPRIGNRTLFAGQGRGLSMDQATQMLIQDGYLSEGASINDALALIKTSLTRPQYNADGIERIAEAEVQARFGDYLAAQKEAAAEGDADPFGMADSFTADELEEVGYTAADPALQAEVSALIAQAEAMDIDTFAILEDIARTYANATQDQYNAAARDALAQAIARGNQDGGSTAAQAAPAAESAAEQGLNRPSALTSQAQAATESVAQTVSTTVEMPPTRQQESSPFARFATGRYRIAIRDEGNGPYAEVVAIQRGSGVEVEMRMPGEALEHPAFSQLNARVQALFETPTASMFDAEPPALELAAQTPAEAAARQDAQEQAAKAEAARQRAADAQAARDEERKRIAQASVRAADNFELGQDPLDSLTGQGGLMFSRGPATEVRNLVTLHNLTEDNLRYADSLGGIPVPSIGITKVESPFGGFGNITLIAPKGMVDPESGVPVFDRDAWTARFPTMNFKKVKAKMADAFYERMKPVRELMAGDDDGFISQLWEQLRNASVQSPEKITSIFTRYEAGRVMYAKEVLGKTIKVPMRNVRPATPVGHDAQLLAYWKKHGAALILSEREMSGAEFSNTPENKAFEEEVQAAIRRYADAAGAPEMAKGFIEQMMPDGTMGAGTRDRLIRDFKTYGTKEVDRIKLGEAVNKAVKRDDPAYLRWVESLVKPLFDEPTITLRGREVAPTLDNIVDAMTVGATAGAEKSMTFSPGKVAAMLGKQFKSLDEIKAARDQVVSAKAETEGKKATDALLDGYRTHVSQFYGGKDWRGNIDTWAANDDSMEALAKAGKLPPSDASIRATLARMNFKGVDQRAVDMAREAIAALRNAATDYFEAKPQRAVGLSEFKGAVVPKGTSPEAIAILEKHGIAVELYGKTEGAREKAIQKLAKRLDKESGGVLFSFAGARAATADTHALVTAQDRLDAGEDPETVRQETGWFQGKDGKWRFEISDADARLKDRTQWTAKIDGINAKRDAALQALWQAKEQRNDFLRARGESPSRISSETKKTPEFKALAKALKNAEAAAEKAQDAAFLARQGDSLITVGDVLSHPALFAAYPGIADVRVDINDSLPAGNAAYAYELQAIELSGKSDAQQLLSTLLHEIQHGIQHIEGFASGGSPNEFRDESADAEMLRDGAILAVMMRSQGTIEKAKALFVQRFKREPAFGSESAALSGESPESMRARADNALAPHERYRRLAGEVEARNTQARQGMTDEQRRATPPSQTADVADSRVIVMFNGKEMANAPMPANAAPDAATTAQPLRTPAATIRAAITKAYGKLLGQLESKGLVTLTQTEDEAIEAAAQARADKGGGDVAQIKQSLMAAVKKSIRAWHGSPHRFDKFSTAEIGSGEGAQVYGWGLYFAGNREVAQYYREKLNDDPVSKYTLEEYTIAGDRNWLVRDDNGITSTYLDDGELRSYVGSAIASDAISRSDNDESWEGEAEYDLAEPALGGALYAVDITPDEDAFLLWDKPLSEQSEAVQSALKINTPLGTAKSPWKITGEQLYKSMSRGDIGFSSIQDDKAASEYLASIGIRGIKYLDGTSRDAGEGSHNYVVFDDADVGIVDIKFSANGAVQGFFDPQTGQSFLIADNLTAEAAPGVLMHEVGIHMAADGSMKALFNRAAMMLKLQRGNPFMKAVQDRMDAAGETSGEEAAAYIAEAYENDRANAPASVQRWLADLLAAVKAWMFKKGIMGADRLTVADIAAVARANARSMARDGGATGGQGFGTAFSRVWHGSPHKFLQFDSSKIGTGEGAQAYGHGLYLAESKGVAGSYQESLSTDPERFLVDGKEAFRRQANGPAFDVSDPKTAAIFYAARKGDKAAREYFAEQGAWGGKAIAELDAMKGKAISRVAPGNLYQVDLPDDQIAKMLDWDKPLSEQTPEVRKLAEKFGYPLDRTGGDFQRWSSSPSGGLSINLRGPRDRSGLEKQSANMFSQAGIPGIRYLDSSSRGNGAGTSNYVIFPGMEKILTIIDVNGEPVTGAEKAKVLGKQMDLAFSRTPGDQTQTEAFKRWFAGSRVVDADGKPLRVFHGTGGDFSVFSRDRAGATTGAANAGMGFFFTDNAEVAGNYARMSREPQSIMPVYLSLQNPLRMEAKNMMEADRILQSGLQPEHDGAIVRVAMRDGGTQTVYMARESSQVKSATGNNGNFDPANPDIRFSRTQTPIPTSAQASLFATPPWQLPEATRTDRLIYELQDGRIDLKRVQEAIAATGKQITEGFDARLAETLMPGRIARRTESFLSAEVKPLLESMAKNNVSQDELSDYLLARHAPERNAQIAKVNDEMPDGGAGTNSQGVLMTTQAARDHIAALTQGKRLVLELLAKRVDDLTLGTREVLVREGLEKQETVDAWTGAYKHYVPLFKDEAMETPGHPIGAGVSVTGTASKRATGSTGEVTNMLAHILMQREAAITRAEKNRVAMSLYGLALTNPNAEMWTTIRPSMPSDQIANELVRMGVDPMEAEVGMQGVPTIRGVDPVSGKVVDRPNPMYKRLDNSLVVKVNGEDRVILFNASNERAVRLVRNLKNQDGVLGQLDLAGSIVGKATRYFASINTQYNPAFGMVNIVRDVGGAMVNLTDTALAGKQARVLSDSIPAMIGIARDLRGDAQRTPWSDLWQQFQDDGGRTGYRDLFIDPYKRADAVQSELDKLGKDGKLTPGAAAHAVLDLLDDFNTTLENGVRLAAYKAALDMKMSRAESARLARELTLDFNRKGRAGREIGPLFAFFNASVQGTARTLKALQGPAGKRILIGGLSLGVIQALMLAAAGFDDDEIPEFIKARAFIIPLAGKQYITIPLQFGLNALPNTGRVVTELLMSGGKDWGEKSFNALGELAGSFNPLGGGNIFTGAGALKTISPTVIDPIIDMATNTDFTGKPIGKERMPWDTRPGFTMGREGTQRSFTGQSYIGISKAINSLTGGNDFAQGLASPSPEEVRYVFTTVGGGVYRELEKILNASVLTAQGEGLKAREVPLGSRFAGEVDDQDLQRSRFFKNSSKIEKLEAQLKGLSKEGRADEARKLIDDNPLVKLYELNDEVRSNVTKLNKLASESINDKEALKRIDAARTTYMRALNDKVLEMEEVSSSSSQN